mmetsp:Transcript_88832/g.276430  ORF Transcript_88832/g.276430 Transcript_88832/m.276430 type:complete len:204 (-) Transcript_88832:256-867(-)
MMELFWLRLILPSLGSGPMSAPILKLLISVFVSTSGHEVASISTSSSLISARRSLSSLARSRLSTPLSGWTFSTTARPMAPRLLSGGMLRLRSSLTSKSRCSCRDFQSSLRSSSVMSCFRLRAVIFRISKKSLRNMSILAKAMPICGRVMPGSPRNLSEMSGCCLRQWMEKSATSSKNSWSRSLRSTRALHMTTRPCSLKGCA